VSRSFLQDIDDHNRHVFNLTSLLDEFLYRQCFNMLVMPMKTQVPTKEQVEGDMGTRSVLEIPGGSQHKPEYLSPPVGPAEFIQAERASTIHEMYRQAAQDIMQELSATSGDASKQSFSRTVPVINKTADTLEHAERRAFRLWAIMQGKTFADGKVSYKDDYAVTNLLDLLIQLQMLFGGIKLHSPTFIREEWKCIVREFDGKLDNKAMDKIVSEITALSDDDIEALFNPPIPVPGAPGDNKASTNVPSTANATDGKKQKRLGSDKRITGATGSKAATKEVLADKNKRSTTPSKAQK
jgi:hypothetical protein